MKIKFFWLNFLALGFFVSACGITPAEIVIDKEPIKTILQEYYQVYQSKDFAKLNNYLAPNLSQYISLKDTNPSVVIANAQDFFSNKEDLNYRPYFDKMEATQKNDNITVKLGLTMSWSWEEETTDDDIKNNDNIYYYKVDVVARIILNKDRKIISYYEDKVYYPQYQVVNQTELHLLSKKEDLEATNLYLAAGEILESRLLSRREESPDWLKNEFLLKVNYKGNDYWADEAAYFDGFTDYEFNLTQINRGLDESGKKFFDLGGQYADERFGIQFDLPADYTANALGPDEYYIRQQQGKQLSGTLPPLKEQVEIKKYSQNKFFLNYYNVNFGKSCEWLFHQWAGVDETQEIIISNAVFYKQILTSEEYKLKIINYCFADTNGDMVTLHYSYSNDLLDKKDDISDLYYIISSLKISGVKEITNVSEINGYKYFIEGRKIKGFDLIDRLVEPVYELGHDVIFYQKNTKDLIFNRILPINKVVSTEGYFYGYLDVKTSRLIISDVNSNNRFDLLQLIDDNLYYLEDIGMPFGVYLYHCGMEMGGCPGLYTGLRVLDLTPEKLVAKTIYSTQTGILQPIAVSENMVTLEESEININDNQQWLETKDKHQLFKGSHLVKIKLNCQADCISEEKVTSSQYNLGQFKDQANNEIKPWLEYWQKIYDNKNLSLVDFFYMATRKLTFDYEYQFSKLKYFSQEVKGKYPISPDGKKLINAIQDYYFNEDDNGLLVSEYGGLDPDSQASLIDLNTGKLRRFLSCGTSCTFSDGFWLDDNSFIVVGVKDFYPAGYDHVDETGMYITPVIYLINLQEQTLSEYQPEEKVREQEYFLKRDQL